MAWIAIGCILTRLIMPRGNGPKPACDELIQAHRTIRVGHTLRECQHGRRRLIEIFEGPQGTTRLLRKILDRGTYRSRRLDRSLEIRGCDTKMLTEQYIACANQGRTSLGRIPGRNDQVTFRIQSHGAAGEVSRAHPQPFIVDQHELAVHVTTLTMDSGKPGAKTAVHIRLAQLLQQHGP